MIPEIKYIRKNVNKIKSKNATKSKDDIENNIVQEIQIIKEDTTTQDKRAKRKTKKYKSIESIGTNLDLEHLFRKLAHCKRKGKEANNKWVKMRITCEQNFFRKKKSTNKID